MNGGQSQNDSCGSGSKQFRGSQALHIEQQQKYNKLNETNDEIQRLRDQNEVQSRLIEDLVNNQSKNGNNGMANQQGGVGDHDPPYSNSRVWCLF